MLEGIVENAEKDAKEAVDAGTDEAHNALVHDLEGLLMEAQDGKFHDFHPNGYPAPKVTLMQKLDIIKNAVMEGKYD